MISKLVDAIGVTLQQIKVKRRKVVTNGKFTTAEKMVKMRDRRSLVRIEY